MNGFIDRPARKRQCLTLVFGLLLSLSTWAAKPQPVIDPEFDPAAIESLYVLPLADLRVEKANPERVAKAFAGMMRAQTKRRRYPATVSKEYASLQPLTRDGLELMDPQMFAQLGPASERYILLFVMHEARTTVALGKSSTVEMTGYLFDKSAEKSLWRHHTEVEISMGGLGGIVMGIGNQDRAVQTAILKLFKGLPKAPKRKRKK